jgi:hypothetical protein
MRRQALGRPEDPLSLRPLRKPRANNLTLDKSAAWLLATPSEACNQRGASMVVEVEYRQRLKDGLRHAALKGIRAEKKPGLIRRLPMRERWQF